MSHWSKRSVVMMLGLLTAVALSLGIALHPLAVDDAFITYRYAHNLATGEGFVYNPERPVLSTTAPFYALLLSAGARLGLDLPTWANGLSTIALWISAVLLFLVGCREKTPWVGALAALFFIAYPLLWLSLGLETAVFLSLALGAILAYRGGRLYLTAGLLALATLARGDGLILTGVIAVDHALHLCKAKGQFSLTRRALGAAAVYVVVMVPLLASLTWQFGSPVPTTLAAKRAQAELGVTGFYSHTTYLQGLGILAGARIAQSPLYILFVPAVAAGLIAMWRRGPWMLLIVAWGGAHLVGYAVLGVTPYYWYYAPLVPGLACAAALGIVESARRVGWHPLLRGLGVLWALGLLVALVRSDWAMVRALDGPVPPPDDPVSKVLPEAKVDVYERAGRWLQDHTPSQALVGVTEVGVMGYYAERPMVDFLGLLEPDVADALERSDLCWALFRYQPDFLALTAVSPLYAYDLRADPWFQAAYRPVQSFDDPRFWGSPVAVYERRVERTVVVEPTARGLPEAAIRLDVDFGGQIRLLGAVAGKDMAQPGDVLALSLYWQALAPMDRDYTVFVHVLGEYDRVIAQRDAAPRLGRGQVVVDPYLLALPDAAYAPDRAVWEVGLYDAATGRRLPTTDGGDHVRLGAVSIEPSADPLRLNFGPVVLTGYALDRLALTPGEPLQVALDWGGEGPIDVTVQLVSEQGDVAAQASGDLNEEGYVLTLPPDALPGAYDLEALVASPVTGQALPLLGADGQPRGDSAQLTKVRVYP